MGLRSLRPRLFMVGIAALTAAGSLVTWPAAQTASAHPEVCATDGKDAGEQGDDHSEICFTQDEIDAMDDSGAQLGVGEVASSPNIAHVANLPKQGTHAGLDALNSDLAFTGRYAIDGNYNGFDIYDIHQPKRPRLVSSVFCPGNQNDVSVFGDVLVTSTDESRSTPECGGEFQSARIKESWEGIRVWDISDKAHPRLATTVETNCGSHTNTILPDPAHNRALVYVQSYNPSTTFPDCLPPHDRISVVEVPLRAPQNAHVVSMPVLFPDGGFPGIPGQTATTSGCHDITVFPARGLAAGACLGQGVLMDISDPVHPRIIDSVTDPDFAFWHSATFSNDGTKVVFTDELGGGGGPTCNPTVGPDHGADAIYEISADRKMHFASHYKIPRVNTNTENCVAHNGSLIPVPGRDIMVQAWYQGGISVWDFTDAHHPRELAFFDRGPLAADHLVVGGSWSAYWYNGAIFSSDIQQGFDVFDLSDPVFKRAKSNQVDFLNVQSQTPFRHAR